MKFKPTPAKAHAGVAIFFLRRLKGKEKFRPSREWQVYSPRLLAYFCHRVDNVALWVCYCFTQDKDCRMKIIE
jgi:hypothetical protein